MDINGNNDNGGSGNNGSSDDSLNTSIDQSANSQLSSQSSHINISTLRIASDLVSRAMFASQGGLTSFGDQRNLYDVLGYKRSITLKDYWDRFKRGGIAKRLINVVPKMAWSGGVDIIENENPEITTNFESDIRGIFERLNLLDMLLRTDILAGTAQYSVALIGVKDGKDLSRPLEKLRSNNPSQIIFLTPIHQRQTSIKDFVEDVSNERFGLPLNYEVNFSRKRGGKQDRKLVHWTRILHHLHNPLDDDVYGDPDLEDVWNLLDDLYKLIGGGSEAAWKQMVSRTLFDIDKDVKSIKEGEFEKKQEELDEMIHGLRQFMMTRGVTPKTFGSTVYDFSSNADTVMQHIAGTKGIALRVIMGTEEGKLAGDQDRENVKFTVSQWCDSHAIPLVRQLADRLIKFGFVRSPKDEKYKVVMGSNVADMSELDKADLAVKLTSANKYQKQAGQPPVLSDSEIRDRAFGLKPLEASNGSNVSDSPPNDPSNDPSIDDPSTDPSLVD